MATRNEEFAHRAAHDMRAPLRQLNGFIDLLKSESELGNDVEAQQWLVHAGNATARLDRMLSGFLSYAKAGSRAPDAGVFEASDSIEEAVAALSSNFETSGVHLQVAASLPRLQGSSAAFCEVVRILLENAIEYRGEVSPAVWIDAEIEADAVVLHMRDNGIGFDMRFAEDIFSVFRSLHPSSVHPGIGIGLATARLLCEANSAEISASSKLGEGSIFSIRWPVAP